MQSFPRENLLFLGKNCVKITNYFHNYFFSFRNGLTYVESFRYRSELLTVLAVLLPISFLLFLVAILLLWKMNKV